MDVYVLQTYGLEAFRGRANIMVNRIKQLNAFVLSRMNPIRQQAASHNPRPCGHPWLTIIFKVFPQQKVNKLAKRLEQVIPSRVFPIDESLLLVIHQRLGRFS
jgi:hypothetical protein